MENESDYNDTDYNDTASSCNVTSPYYVGKVGTFEFVLKCAILPIIVVGGVIGNTLCYVVLRREKKQKSLNFILKGLAIVDSFVLISLILFQTIPAAYGFSGWAWALAYQLFYQRVGKSWIICFQWVSKMASIYLTMFVTLERYIAISRPLQAQFICTLKNARIGTFLIVLFSIVYNLPKLFYYEMFQDGYDLCLETVAPLGDRTALYKTRLFIEFYVLGMYFIVIYIFPLVSLFVLNALLIAMVRKSYRDRAKMSGQVSNDKCTEKIIGIVSAFIILETPAIFVNLYYSQKTLLTDADFQVLNMIYILSSINCVINFYIYVLVGRAFRDRLAEVLGCKKPTGPTSWSSRKKVDDSSYSGRQSDYKVRDGQRNVGTSNGSSNGPANGVNGGIVTVSDQVTHL